MDWYYAALDMDWNPDDDGFYDWQIDADDFDEYPELWVGRLPVRDSTEAEGIVEKLFTYERRPALGLEVPPDSFYTKAILAAGLTNSGKWGSPNNGIYVAESWIWDEVLKDIPFTAAKLYSALGESAVCNDSTGAYLECYKDIKDYFIDEYGQYPPENVNPLSAAKMLDALQSEHASVFFHFEHSGPHSLGGPWTDPGDVSPDTTVCQDAAPCDSAFCSASWDSACFESYKQANTFGFLTRELLGTLNNGPSYFVGLSIGSYTGQYERESVDEVLVRDANGGAVAFCGKIRGWGPHTSVSKGFFEYSLVDGKPAGVALYNGIMDTPPGVGRRQQAAKTWILLGDPSMQVWSEAPDQLTVTHTPTDIKLPGLHKVTITVKDDGNNAVPGARVALNRVDEVYAIGWTDSSGVATFPSLFVPYIVDTIDVWATKWNAAPAHDGIPLPVSFNPTGFAARVVYRNHVFSDSAGSGTATDELEAGDVVDLEVTIASSGGGVPPGTAKLVMSPRVKASLLIEEDYDPEKVIIGKGKANPPAESDTFALMINEYGIRPEYEPVIDTTGAFYVWRDTNAVYHLLAHYDTSSIGDSYEGMFTADGGLTLVDSLIDSVDSVTLTSGIGDTIKFLFEGDATDDTLTFLAEAEDWVETLRDTASYDSIPKNATTTVDFRLKLKPDLPPRTQLNLSLFGGDNSKTVTDFYLEAAAPDVDRALWKILPAADVQDTPPTECDCEEGGLGDSLFVLKPLLLNLGDANADSILVKGWASGDSVYVCHDEFQMSVDAGEDEWGYGIWFCDEDRTMHVDSILATRTIEGETDTLGFWENFDAWPFGATVDSLCVDAAVEGLRLTWGDPEGQVDVLGYHVYWDSSGAGSDTVRLTQQPLKEARMIWARELDYADAGGDPIDYRLGVSIVSTDYVEGPIAWSSDQRTNLPEREGWPVKAPKGAVSSVALVDIDDDTDLEIVAAGRVISAWDEDGTSATSDDNGLLYDPVPDTSDIEQEPLRFYGDIAAGDIDGDNETEIAGCFGDGNLYVFDENADSLWSKTINGKSTPTLSDLDGDGNLEVIVNTYPDGKLYVFEEDGNAFGADTTGLFVDLGEGDSTAYNYSGVAVGNLDKSADDSLEIVHPTTGGWVYAWRGRPGVSGNPPKLWEYRVTTNMSAKPRVSTPAVGFVNNDDSLDVVFSTRTNYGTVQALRGPCGVPLYKWDLLDGRLLDENLIQPPSLGEIGDNANILEVVVGRSTTNDTLGIVDSVTTVSLYSVHGSSRLIATGEDSIPLPGRRGEKVATTHGYPVLADIDDDSKIEILIGSNQGGLYCWEATWDSGDTEFDLVPEKGWPIIFSEPPGTPAIDDLDEDGFSELVVPAGDYVHVYDLPGVEIEWGAAAHDARRTGNTEGGGSGQPFMPQDPNTVDLAGDPGLMPSGPNPFNPIITLRYRVPSKSKVSLSIYDVAGRRQRELVKGVRPAGVHELRWDGRSDSGHQLSSGVYFVRLKIGEFEQSRKVVIAK
jgi:hypothetical protein